MDQNPSFSLAVGVHHIPVQRHARYCTLGAQPATARHLWIGLHGYAMLARSFTRLLAPLADEGANLVVTPEALSRFYLETERNGRHGDLIGATWLTREDRDQDLADSLRYLDQLHQAIGAELRPEADVNILGFSQGAVMAARWVAAGAVTPQHLVLWGIVPPEEVVPALAERMANREVTLIAGERDPFAPAGSLEALAATLARHGVRARAERFDGGHSLSKELLRRLGAAGHA
ncbi:MAG TPA: hypothetical protein VLD58_03585 [Gemmatimonadales bacterium]|nr:hypothetical protein [Gemmatimonadales bacterium]